MASSQLVSPGTATTNGTSPPDSHKTTTTPTPSNVAASASSPSKALSSLSPLLPARPVVKPGFTPRSPRTMSLEEKRNADNLQSPNTAALLGAGFGMGVSGEDPPKDGSPTPRELGSLPGVAAAAAAMDTSGGSPTTTTGSMASSGTTVEGSGTTVTAGPATSDLGVVTEMPQQYHPLQPQPPKIGDPSSATAPAPPFGPITPTTPFSPGGSSVSGRAKHICPHCLKAFTRHHNLKSHLLTHAHEKPYLCTTCQARFRRLHDLKRHSKLHTGERPHVCIRCGRRFARGDALARHARAEGGCAGRRGSMGGMLNEDGSMSGMGGDVDGLDELEGLIDDQDVHMADAGSREGEGSDGNPRRRVSLPSICTNDLQQQQPQQAPQTPMGASGRFQQRPQPQHPTYPPSGTRTSSTSGPSPSGGLFPPNAGRGSFKVDPTVTPSSIPPASTSAPPSANVLTQPGGIITDSPGALSPGMTSATDRERTPSFASSFLPSTRTPAPQANMGPHNNTNVFAAGMEGVWAYIRTLEERVKYLEDRIASVNPPPPPPLQPQLQPQVQSQPQAKKAKATKGQQTTASTSAQA